MVLEFANSPQRTLLLSQKWSTTILNELMSLAGSPIWSKWVEARTAAGESVLPGQESYVKKKVVRKTSMKPRNANQKVVKTEDSGEAVEEKGSDELKELLGLGDMILSDVTVVGETGTGSLP